ncbi:hypothetical protein B0T16DRAFT_407952 [Cercophora newfieldiana]|uniref:Uncharacterized protein n=1 Tax=Cercophora newfieldiana TaxID=92897 RepID=A0AA39Y907_9PEZI|nr:hypothetical protein B0T16DRAFT_407952 [Cercophora newfieldiana]
MHPTLVFTPSFLLWVVGVGPRREERTSPHESQAQARLPQRELMPMPQPHSLPLWL